VNKYGLLSCIALYSHHTSKHNSRHISTTPAGGFWHPGRAKTTGVPNRNYELKKNHIYLLNFFLFHSTT